jgi:hypothetical protein
MYGSLLSVVGVPKLLLSLWPVCGMLRGLHVGKPDSYVLMMRPASYAGLYLRQDRAP